jgi:hypothetical protein
MYETTFEGYMLFRMTEAEHVASYKTRALEPEWVSKSTNPEYERFLFDAYEKTIRK